jgi:hypothetical protein
MDAKYLPPNMVESVYGLDKGTLANWRMNGKGPEYVKLERKILYHVAKIEEWLEKHKVLTN